MVSFSGNNETVSKPVKNNKWFQDFRGKLTKYIGTGENARHSLVLIVITGLLIIFVLITVLIFIDKWLTNNCDENKNIVKDIVDLWEMVLPVITLALGYAFGKNKN